MIIKVPATTANLGPGFDSFGLALDLYLELEVLEPSAEWEITHLMEGIPSDSSNLIIKTALSVCSDLPPHRLKMTTNIPPARGLGSSSSAIVAGIELANQLGHLKLTDQQKVSIATQIEGHPDNVAPAILGGFVVATTIKDKTYYNQHNFPSCAIIAVIPDYELLTSASRDALPSTIDYSYGVEASSIANMSLSFLLAGNMKEAAFLMEQDKWHEPYRKSLVKELQDVRELKKDLGFYSALLSGAGPTVLVLAKEEDCETICETFETKFSECDIKSLQVDNKGVEVIG